MVRNRPFFDVSAAEGFTQCFNQQIDKDKGSEDADANQDRGVASLRG
jgi:hypothetical protein